MDDHDKEREPGCFAMLFLLILISALWSIGSDLERIAQALEKLGEQKQVEVAK